MAPVSSVLGDIPALAKSFERSLRAANRSPRTVETYLEAVAQVADIDGGIVPVRPLPGPVSRYGHLLGRAVA